jgi:hypothetical protein
MIKIINYNLIDKIIYKNKWKKWENNFINHNNKDKNN